MTVKDSKDYCPNCQQITNHKCLFNVGVHSENYDDFHWSYFNETVQCLGCENIQFRTRFSHEDMFDYDEGQYYEIKYFPKNLPNHLSLKNLYHLSDKLRIVYNETLEALKNNCYLLAAVGLRAIIEAICLDQNIAGKDLKIKINNLVRNKLITEKDAKRLHSIRFLGNDSVHEMDVPKEEKLRIALDIVEHLIKNLYLIDIDVNQHLETVISDYEDFKNLILRKFKATTVSVGEEKNVKEILKKDFRRIESNYLPNFITLLIDEINNNIVTSISIGKLENNQQFFIKN